MKKLFLISVVYLSMFCSVQAQDRQILFEESRIWKEILDKANQGKKLIFLDCYTSWCVPCKQLVDSIFSKNEVADFFNTHFLCAHLDVEKDPDGNKLFQQIGGSAVPTLAFFDPQSEELVHMVVGVQDQETLMAEAKIALDPENNLAGVTRRFEQGNRDTVLLNKYLKMLTKASLRDQQRKVVSDYLETLPDEQFLTLESWQRLKEYVQNPLDNSLKRAIKMRKELYQVVGKNEVDHYLSSMLSYAVQKMSDSPMFGIPFDAEENEALLTYLKSIDYEEAPAALASLTTAAYARQKDFNGMLDYMQKAVADKMFVHFQERSFIINNLSRLVLCDDPAVVRKGIAWLDRECDSTDHCLYQASLLHIKAELLHYLGEEKEMLRSKEKEDACLQRAMRESGVHIMRAFKNYGSGRRIL